MNLNRLRAPNKIALMIKLIIIQTKIHLRVLPELNKSLNDNQIINIKLLDQTTKNWIAITK